MYFKKRKYFVYFLHVQFRKRKKESKQQEVEQGVPVSVNHEARNSFLFDVFHVKTKKKLGRVTFLKDFWDRYWRCAIQLFGEFLDPTTWPQP